MSRRIVGLLMLVACARGRNEERVVEPLVDAAPPTPVDAAPTDAPPLPDASTCTMPFTGTLATWSFSGAAGGQPATVAATSASGVVAGSVTRAAGLTAVSGATSINASGWPLATTIDPAKYYTFTIAPPSGCTSTLTSAALDARASGTGPASAALATSIDAFAAKVPVSTTAATTATLAVANASGTVEVRIYGYGAAATTGTLRLQNTISLVGSLQ